MVTIQVVTEDYFAWAVGRRDFIGHREIIEPHNNEVHEMDQHGGGKSFAWEGTNDLACAFLDTPEFYVQSLQHAWPQLVCLY